MRKIEKFCIFDCTPRSPVPRGHDGRTLDSQPKIEGSNPATGTGREKSFITPTPGACAENIIDS